ncbi:MAG: hypothetical protein WC553_01185 [Patescibacteria group bacterium]|jgi:hypothetical protein
MKPKPFVRSFWGIAFILILTLVLLGVKNYRTNYFGFNLDHSNLVGTLIDKKQAGTAHLITSDTELAKLCHLTKDAQIDWQNQVVFAFFGLTKSSDQLELTSLRRQGADVNLHYAVTPRSTPTTNYPVLLTVVDRTRLIASSTLTVKFINNNTITNLFTITPDQI